MKTKSKSISEILRQEIIDGKFDEARKLPSEHQLMRRFSAARETVRGAIRELTRRELVDTRPGYGTFLSDRASRLATQCFGVIVPDAYYPFYARICAGIESGAKKHGYTTLTAALGSGEMHERAIKAVEFAEVCKSQKVSGVFLQPIQLLDKAEEFNRSLLSVFAGADIPVVLLDSDFATPPTRSGYDIVSIDNTNAGYRLAGHLISKGAKRVVYFSNRLAAPSSLRRGSGVSFAVTEAGLVWNCGSIVIGDPSDTRFLKRIFRGADRPDGIVAVNDYIAVKLLESLTSMGMRVPGDVMLAGINGDECAEKSTPGLTTMVQPCREIGQTAVEIMLQRLADRGMAPRETLLMAELVERASTGGNAGISKSRKGKKK
jgi:DNA-binding LacI/PurR family transcriptional regulator